MIVNRPSKAALIAADEWARKQIRMNPDYPHVKTLRDELAWRTERDDRVAAALANLEAAHHAVVPLQTMWALLAEEDR